jgi:C_GCAxxG_C_C family probable redox protein
MNHRANAHAKFLDNYACSQAIFSEYCKDFDIDPKIALSVSAGFAGGMRMGKTCGAVAGALMVLGLRYSGPHPETPEGRQKVYEAVTTFTKRFYEINGSTDCKELLAVDISTAEGMEMAKEKNLFRTVCPKFITDAASLLEEI